jgi:CHAT domain-containing protein
MTSWYGRCIAAFAAYDYRLCSGLILEQWNSGVPVECGLWLLIAAQRLHHPSAAALREEMLKQTRGRPYERAFVLAACGELDTREADIYRTDPRRSCAMDYYLGAGLLTKGDTESAQRLFGLASTIGEDGQPERFLATHALASPAPFGLTAADNVTRLCESAVNLHNQGFYRAAAKTTGEALALAAGITRTPGDGYCSMLRIAATCRTSNRDPTGARQIYEELLSVADSGDDRAIAYIGLARLDFAARDYASAAHGLAEVLGSGSSPKDRASLELEERFLRSLASVQVTVDAAEHVAALDRLAGIYWSLGEPGLTERALTFLGEQAGLGVSGTATVNLRLGGLHTKGGWYQDAVEPTEAVYDDQRQHLGDDHPFVDRIRENLIVLHAVLGNSEALRRHAAQALAVGRAALARPHLSGNDFARRLHVAYTLGLLGLVVSLSSNQCTADPEFQAAAALAVAERKGVTLEEAARARLASLADASEQQRLRRPVRENYTELIGQVIAGRQPDLQNIGIRLANAESYLDSAALAKATAPLRIADLTSALPPDGCLVDFVLYRQFDIDRAQQVAADGQDSASQRFFQESGFYTLVAPVGANWFEGSSHDVAHPEDRYAAVVLTCDHGPAVIDIADARYLDKLVNDTVCEIIDPLSRLGSTPELAGIDRLSRVLIDPLWKLIQGYNQVIISPDASLCRVPFEILRTPEGRLVLDGHLVSYAASARSVRHWSRPAAASGPPDVYGDPDFGVPASGRRAVRFRPLPATSTEAHAVAHELGVTAVLGRDARKDRIIACRSPRVLHIASHAFFVADLYQLLGAERGTLPSIIADDPMLRSGIALTGANDTLAGTAGVEGVLFAREVLDLDLTGTELVVLSACDSGLGQVSAGHGVYGLRRAFSIAGARSQLMGLWQVPSTETADLMITFYRLLSQGVGRAAALARAKGSIRREKPHPYYWAGFILEGAPGPLAC